MLNKRARDQTNLTRIYINKIRIRFQLVLNSKIRWKKYIGVLYVDQWQYSWHICWDSSIWSLDLHLIFCCALLVWNFMACWIFCIFFFVKLDHLHFGKFNATHLEMCTCGSPLFIYYTKNVHMQIYENNLLTWRIHSSHHSSCNLQCVR